MYAYPVATDVSIDRVIKLAKSCDNFYVRLDGAEAAELLNKAAAGAGLVIKYTLIIDSGLHRFGVAPDKVVDLANSLKNLSIYNFVEFLRTQVMFMGLAAMTTWQGM